MLFFFFFFFGLPKQILVLYKKLSSGLTLRGKIDHSFVGIDLDHKNTNKPTDNSTNQHIHNQNPQPPEKFPNHLKTLLFHPFYSSSQVFVLFPFFFPTARLQNEKNTPEASKNGVPNDPFSSDHQNDPQTKRRNDVVWKTVLELLIRNTCVFFFFFK